MRAISAGDTPRSTSVDALVPLSSSVATACVNASTAGKQRPSCCASSVSAKRPSSRTAERTSCPTMRTAPPTPILVRRNHPTVSKTLICSRSVVTGERACRAAAFPLRKRTAVSPKASVIGASSRDAGATILRVCSFAHVTIPHASTTQNMGSASSSSRCCCHRINRRPAMRATLADRPADRTPPRDPMLTSRSQGAPRPIGPASTTRGARVLPVPGSRRGCKTVARSAVRRRTVPRNNDLNAVCSGVIHRTDSYGQDISGGVVKPNDNRRQGGQGLCRMATPCPKGLRVQVGNERRNAAPFGRRGDGGTAIMDAAVPMTRSATPPRGVGMNRCTDAQRDVGIEPVR